MPDRLVSVQFCLQRFATVELDVFATVCFPADQQTRYVAAMSLPYGQKAPVGLCDKIFDDEIKVILFWRYQLIPVVGE